MPPRPIIIDTDPGQDDAAAILLALASPELRVLGLTTVCGNVPLEATTRNALMLLEVAERTDVGVYPGCPRPLLREPVHATHVHGGTGLDGCGLPEPRTEPRAQHGVDFLIETIARASEPVTLVPIGPLTNVAMALVKAPAIRENIREVVIMGGGLAGGNITPAAEFNIHHDPHAAHVVFTSGLPITLFPLDLTLQVITTPERLERIRAIGTPVSAAMAGMLDFYNGQRDPERYGIEGGPLHDPVTVAYLLQPDLFGGKACNVRVETAGELTMGQTVADWWGVTGLPATATVMTRVDAPAFFELLIERLARLEPGSGVSTIDAAAPVQLED